MKNKFIADVDEGLSRQPKTLPSKYFYDKRGDELFMQIMELPEYYLTRAELEIFTEQTDALIDKLGVSPDKHFELIELGAGDGTKTQNLLKALLAKHYQFDYLPVDLSHNVLEHLQSFLVEQMPELSIKPECGDYLEIVGKLHASAAPKVVLFLGSTIGNLSDLQAAKFIYDLGRHLDPGEKLLLGVDLVKSEDIVLPAYNDSRGVTRDFNINLLRRINNELDANFDLDAFDHRPEYEQEVGVAKSFIVSTAEQSVNLGANGRTYQFAKGEKILTEISRKYNEEILGEILQDTDFEVIDILTDSNDYFADYIIERR
jgi:L-histidine N-alpha-methyltransferase